MLNIIAVAARATNDFRLIDVMLFSLASAGGSPGGDILHAAAMHGVT